MNAVAAQKEVIQHENIDEVVSETESPSSMYSGINLRLLRMEAGLSQQEIASYIGISQSMVSRLEQYPETIEVRHLQAWVQACARAKGAIKGFGSLGAAMVMAAAIFPPFGLPMALGLLASHNKDESFERIMSKIGALFDVVDKK